MAEDFAGMGIAIIVVTASIVLAGILIGIGRAFGYKRIEYFGIEELIQSVINAALIGSFVAVIGLIGTASSSITLAGCSQGSVIDQLICTLSTTSDLLFGLFQQMVQVLDLLGYYQGLSLDFGAFSVSPFGNLASVSSTLSAQLLSLDLAMMLIELNRQMALFVSQNALALIFPIGLVLRTVFATRKVGGFLIALAVGLYIFYPAFVLIFPGPQAEINASITAMGQLTNNSYYAPVPVIDLNDNYAIAGKLDIMSGRCSQNLSNTSACQDFINALPQNSTATADFSSDLTLVVQRNTTALSKSLLYAVIAPLFSLLLTIVFVKELGSLLGSEIGIKTVASI